MAGHFTYHFEGELPTVDYQREWERFQGKPLLSEVTEQAHETIRILEAFQALPEGNQRLVLGMASYALGQANHFENRWRENFWGLYVVGSRARGEARPDSDLDLLSAGTFYRAQGFAESRTSDSDVFDGFSLDIPEELPNEYNVGYVDRKYLVRAAPSLKGMLPVDLSVVDLTFTHVALEDFRESMDVAESGEQLARVPMVELTVEKEALTPLHW